MILSLRSLKRGQLLPGDLFSEAIPEFWRKRNLGAEGVVMLLVQANMPVWSEHQDDNVLLATLTQDDRKELHVIVHETEHED